MYQRILAPVDGSGASDLALQEAIRLAKDQQAQLRILHVVDTVTVNWDTEFGNIGDILETLRKAAESILARAEDMARQAGIAAETRLVEMKTLPERIPAKIVEEADLWPADIIVIGTHGRHGLNRLLMGSVAEGVARISPKPVLLIRAQA
ncbi:MAG: universal stress protein [Pseudomonadota bacterium]|jgi:nucleotide-binding universal stress UspA family protein